MGPGRDGRHPEEGAHHTHSGGSSSQHDERSNKSCLRHARMPYVCEATNSAG